MFNAVADKVNEFVESVHPEKIVKTITFAYGPTISAPVEMDENGNYTPVDETWTSW